MGFGDVLMIIWFYEKKKVKLKIWFLNKNYFYESQVVNLLLKYFFFKLKFYKINFEICFCQLAWFTRNSILQLALTRFLRYTHCMMILMLIDAGCSTFGRESINSVWLDCHRIRWWLDANHWGRDGKPS